MRIWETLGLEPTADISAIRKAYAAQLKLHHPEDDPEGYQRLREAYDTALKQAKRQRAAGIYDANAEQGQDAGHSQAHDSFEHAPAAKPASYGAQKGEPVFVFEVSPDQEADRGAVEGADPPRNRHPMEEGAYSRQADTDPLDRFMAQVATLYADFPARIQSERWTELLQEDIVWDLRLQPVLMQRLLIFFDRCCFLPAQVWKLLTQTFQWLDASPFELRHRYPNVFNYAYDKAYRAAVMDYESLLGAGTMDYDAYLRHREAAWLALQDNELPAMKAELDQASPMYDGDPDLVYLQAAYCWRNADFKGALARIERFLALLPAGYDHKDALSLAASVLERNRRGAEARVLRARVSDLNSRSADRSISWRKPPRRHSSLRVKLWFGLRYMVLGIRWVIALLILASIIVHAISSLGSLGGSHSVDPDELGAIGQKLGNRNAPPGSKQVALELSDLYFTGVQEKVTDDGGEERRQYSVFGDPSSLLDHPNTVNAPGYMFIGTHGGITYYVSVNYEIAAAMSKSHRATVTGLEYPVFPAGLQAEIAANGIDRKPEENAQPYRYLLATLVIAR